MHSRLERLAAAAVLLTLSSVARAEDVEKKFRVGFALGGYNTQDEIRSASANRLILVDEQRTPTAVFIDPRNDDAAIGDLKIQAGIRATLSASFAVNSMLVLEGAVGYQKGDVGDIEVQAYFDDRQLEENEDYHFDVYRIPAGEMTQIPIQFSAFARFRPKANLNPYVGGGAGFTIIGFDSSAELDQLSVRMDQAVGALARVQNSINGVLAPDKPDSSLIADLSGANVDARDTFAWHLAGGMEYSFRRKWAAFADLRYVFASRAFRIGFNGGESLGITVPNRTEDENSSFANQSYGPMYLPNTGLIDGGRIAPLPTAPPSTDCAVTPGACAFTFQPDGVTDPGEYYVQGGTVKYGGVSFQVGIRYTF